MRQAKVTRNILSGIENLLLHKLRSFLTMLGVVFGVGSVVAMLAVGEGASKEALERIKKLGSNNIIISSKKSAEEEATSTTRSFMSVYGLTYEDYDRLVASIPHIDKAVPVKILRKESRLGSQAMELRVLGVTEDWFDLVPREVLAGRVLTSFDNENSSPVTVLTEYGARKLLATKSTIGQSVRIGGDYFEVAGIVRSESGQAGSMQIPDQEIDAYIPIRVARSYFGDVFTKMTSGSRLRELVELHQIIAQVDDTSNVELAAAAIQRMFEDFHKKPDYEISVPLALLKEAQATKRRFNIVLGSIAGISLLVGGIGIMKYNVSLGDRAYEGNRHTAGDRRQTQADNRTVPH